MVATEGSIAGEGTLGTLEDSTEPVRSAAGVRAATREARRREPHAGRLPPGPTRTSRRGPHCRMHALRCARFGAVQCSAAVVLHEFWPVRLFGAPIASGSLCDKGCCVTSPDVASVTWGGWRLESVQLPYAPLWPADLPTPMRVGV